MDMIKAGTWVEISKIILEPHERTGRIPEETKKNPFVLKAKGFLLKDAALGNEVEIESLIGRKLFGKLIGVDPGYHHSFGPPIIELLIIGSELRKILKGN
jgi:hypothetical protein